MFKKLPTNIQLLLKHLFYVVISAIISCLLTYVSNQNFGVFTVGIGLLCQAGLNVWEQWESKQDPQVPLSSNPTV